MRELAQHITDLIENSVRAGASHISVDVVEDLSKDSFRVCITDDGSGMSPEMAERVTDAFYTTRTCRRVGLGLPLLAASAERCDGYLQIDSALGRGTTVTAQFRHQHIDRPPLGNLNATLLSALVGHPEVDIVYRHTLNGRTFELDGAAIKKELDDVPLSHPSIFRWLEQYLNEGLAEIGVQSAPAQEEINAKAV